MVLSFTRHDYQVTACFWIERLVHRHCTESANPVKTGIAQRYHHFFVGDWVKVKLIDDPALKRDFDVPDCFSALERELLSFLQVKIGGKFLRIVGDPGTGKSTLIRYMFRDYLPQQPFFAKGKIIVIDLAKAPRTRREFTYEQTVDLEAVGASVSNAESILILILILITAPG